MKQGWSRSVQYTCTAGAATHAAYTWTCSQPAAVDGRAVHSAANICIVIPIVSECIAYVHKLYQPTRCAGFHCDVVAALFEGLTVPLEPRREEGRRPRTLCP